MKVTMEELYERIPSSVWESAERWPISPMQSACVNFDFDFQDFFASPFYYADVTDENQITVGYFDGQRKISPRTQFLRA